MSAGLGSGAAAAATVEQAATVLRAVARGAGGWDDGPGMAAQADGLARRAAALADEDATVYARAVALLGGASPRTPVETSETLARAADVPLRIAAAAADVAELARDMSAGGPAARRADVVGCALLAEAAAAACSLLVAVNLTAAPGDPRRVAADAEVARARAAREAAEERLAPELG